MKVNPRWCRQNADVCGVVDEEREEAGRNRKIETKSLSVKKTKKKKSTSNVEYKNSILFELVLKVFWRFSLFASTTN